MNNKNLEEAKIFFTEGLKFLQEENYQEAEIKFIKSLDLSPGRLSIIHNLISIYINTDQKYKLKKLLENYKNLSEEKEILYGKAFSFYFENNYLDSIAVCKKIVEFQEFKFSIQDLLASNFKKQKKFLDALKLYKQKLKEKKNHLVFYNIGLLFSELGRTRIAKYYFNKCREIKKDDHTNLFSLALCKLKLKDFENGFLLYENRFKKQNPIELKFQHIKSPNFLSEIKDKKILIWDEQGLGDTLQFSRFVIDLLKFTDQITFVVNSKLSQILSGLDKNILVKSYDNLNSENFDYQIPLCSLPKYLDIKTTEEINFFSLKYINKFDNHLLLDNKKLNIGIAWSGNKEYFLDTYRSIPFKYFKNILNLKDINFFKLSKDLRDEDKDKFTLYPNLIDLSKRSLAEVSDYIKHLDLVISSDTSIIHLAGILNKKSILLLNYNSDWRWFDGINNTVWYPSVQVIKQSKFNSWNEVFTKLEKKLEKLKLDKKKPE
tara:strand:- start:86 stop:1552 length:1467 start_codon:yes stop_codon:yes gene_type:complete